MKNVEKAVGIIAGLSLLLGLSLGQNHHQHLKLKALQAASFAPVVELSSHRHRHVKCEMQSERLHERMQEVHARLEGKRMLLEEQRRHFEEAYVRSLEESELNRVHFEIKDPENGANTIIRIVREE